MSDDIDRVLNLMVEDARSTGSCMRWAEAWAYLVTQRPELLDPSLPPNEMAGWMVGWFANVQESCRHNRAEATAAFEKFMATQ